MQELTHNKEYIITQLKSLIWSLRKYAHSPDCQNHKSCPNNHDQCSQRLNLDTGIAWELANVMSLLLDCIRYPELVKRFAQDYSTTLRVKLRETTKVTASFYRVVEKHEKSYRGLASLIDQTISLLCIIEKALEDSIT